MDAPCSCHLWLFVYLFIWCYPHPVTAYYSLTFMSNSKYILFYSFKLGCDMVTLKYILVGGFIILVGDSPSPALTTLYYDASLL